VSGRRARGFRASSSFLRCLGPSLADEGDVEGAVALLLFPALAGGVDHQAREGEERFFRGFLAGGPGLLQASDAVFEAPKERERGARRPAGEVHGEPVGGDVGGALQHAGVVGDHGKELGFPAPGLDRERPGVALGEGGGLALAGVPGEHVLAGALDDVVTGALADDGGTRHQAELTLRVQVLDQALEGLGVATMGGGGDQEQVRDAPRQLPHQAETLVAAPVVGGKVGLVHHHQVPVLGKDQGALVLALSVVDAGDDPLEDLPGALTPGEAAQGGAVGDLEGQVEEPAKRLLPIGLEVGRGEDEHAAGGAAKQELLNDEPGLDRLAETDVVGDEEADPGRVSKRHQERNELVVVGDDPGALEGEEGGVGVLSLQVLGLDVEPKEAGVGGGTGRGLGGALELEGVALDREVKKRAPAAVEELGAQKILTRLLHPPEHAPGLDHGTGFVELHIALRIAAGLCLRG